ncbi:type II 3-dehydroquinate dehydratase [Frankia sp. CNm7]|uniref:3-dehydroquinate dehydratase n=1 Tax=Frankia nepalensis TaxID=1836974 RepID=A0A937UQQ6_9ACTN|nr:type II 3-dehydroquinate dehydratase [Frankia nepalensis]MBL7502200.1 type II 3-dehydroquinate dehydratase [Frankia nepalensis]MBL7513473.1 type II 3-dehydroquinate dehydratase [Frankia nepalensis]MBL7522629.1 type II 3-dehydroquinate dehydratase [Frankia nepalensis]MBL7630343.1 type II 3-dehydroquinate dehydratase [Frankia nepalensis]
MTPILVLSGVNLGRLGKREPAVYGRATYADLVAEVEKTAAELGVAVACRQTDDEATMIGWLHEAADTGAAVILNPGAWTHYSYALRDAAAALAGPLIEVHLSQVAAREPFRHVSVIGPVATGTITGLGIQGYLLALRALATMGGPGVVEQPDS